MTKEAVIKAFEDQEDSHKVAWTIKAVKKIVESIPENTGRWMDYQKDRWIYAKCSNCETVHDTQTNYCPTCGIKMEVKHDQS